MKRIIILIVMVLFTMCFLFSLQAQYPKKKYSSSELSQLSDKIEEIKSKIEQLDGKLSKMERDIQRKMEQIITSQSEMKKELYKIKIRVSRK